MIDSIVVCGTGRLGLPLALNFERIGGLVVTGYDVNTDYVSRLNARDFVSDEPGVSGMLQKSHVHFSTDIATVLDAELAVVCVKTDSVSSGAYDLRHLVDFVDALTNAIAVAIAKEQRYHLRAVVVNCNVNPGTCQRVAGVLSAFGIEVYFWPEWVKQGSIVQDQKHPSVTVIGTQLTYKLADEVSLALTSLDQTGRAPVKWMSLTEAELCKISLNCFLTVKISFANMVATLLEELGFDATRVLDAVGEDPRIGGAFLKPGFGYGGPCLPRDNGAMTAFASSFGVAMPLCEAADIVNTQRHMHLSRRAVRNYHEDALSPRVDSLSYKIGIPIFTESQQLRFAEQMSSLGISTHVTDSVSFQRIASLPEGKSLLLTGGMTLATTGTEGSE